MQCVNFIVLSTLWLALLPQLREHLGFPIHFYCDIAIYLDTDGIFTVVVKILLPDVIHIAGLELEFVA